jgi:hypothetical protein
MRRGHEPAGMIAGRVMLSQTGGGGARHDRRDTCRVYQRWDDTAISGPAHASWWTVRLSHGRVVQVECKAPDFNLRHPTRARIRMEYCRRRRMRALSVATTSPTSFHRLG